MRKTTPLAARFWSRVERWDPDHCWEWTGTFSGGRYSPYGVISVGPAGNVTRHYAHRLSYELNVGPIPPGLTIDHLCGRTLCVNPKHMEPVPQGVNTLRGDTASGRHLRQTACLRGHPFDEVNTKWTPRGWRRCRTCDRVREAKRHRRRAA